MRTYRDVKFTGEVAEFVQDRLDECMFGITPKEYQPSSVNNLVRAGMVCSRRAQQLHTAMHDVDNAYWKIGAVTLPDDASPDLVRRLDRMMNKLADLSDELSELWNRQAESIWTKIPFHSRVERLQVNLAELEYWKDDEEARVRVVDLLQFRTRIDPDAAEAAGVGVSEDAKTALDAGPFHDASFRTTAVSVPCSE